VRPPEGGRSPRPQTAAGQGQWEARATQFGSRGNFGLAGFCFDNDLNKDGTVTRGEFDIAVGKRFALVASGAAMMNAEQFAGDLERRFHDSNARTFKRLDKDGDGKLTLAEFAANELKLFARLDKNTDGAITADEMRPRSTPEEIAMPARGRGPIITRGAREAVRSFAPRMETAISAGLLAPIARPTGPWMRASASSAKPWALRRESARHGPFRAQGRCKRPVRRARQREPDRRSWGRAPTRSARCGGQAASAPVLRRAIRAKALMPGNRSAVAKAVRGSITRTQ